MQNHTEFKDIAIEFKMIFIEGGAFEMGSNNEKAHEDETPLHKVKLRNFWMGEFPVTQAIWGYVMQDTDISNPSYFKAESRPVENVSWEEIDKLFLPKLNDITKDNRLEGTYYRLPTETEWEYAARGGKYWSQYPFIYAGSDKLDEVGWHEENSHQETKVVGLKTMNLLGLYDMNGNAMEWCDDLYKPYERSINSLADDYEGIITSSRRVIRGGSWFNYVRRCLPI